MLRELLFAKIDDGVFDAKISLMVCKKTRLYFDMMSIILSLYL